MSDSRLGVLAFQVNLYLSVCLFVFTFAHLSNCALFKLDLLSVQPSLPLAEFSFSASLLLFFCSVSFALLQSFIEQLPLHQ